MPSTQPVLFSPSVALVKNSSGARRGTSGFPFLVEEVGQWNPVTSLLAHTVGDLFQLDGTLCFLAICAPVCTRTFLENPNNNGFEAYLHSTAKSTRGM